MGDNTSAKPFLRWAGGKTWLIKNLVKILEGVSYINYHEPFLGGGAVFMSLQPANGVFLSDSNADLINAYQCVKLSPEKIYEYLNEYENTPEEYYKIRAISPASKIEQAARFIYLNQTSFNGLYRVNREGKYNVPYGYRKRANFDFDNMKRVQAALQNSELTLGDFAVCKDKIQKADLVYLDPPYVVSKEGNGFIGYNQQLFSLEDQKRLSNLIDYIRDVGAYYILSYAKHETVYETFNKNDTVMEVTRSSLIGGKKAYRGQTVEYVFTNIS